MAPSNSPILSCPTHDRHLEHSIFPKHSQHPIYHPTPPHRPPAALNSLPKLLTPSTRYSTVSRHSFSSCPSVPLQPWLKLELEACSPARTVSFFLEKASKTHTDVPPESHANKQTRVGYYTFPLYRTPPPCRSATTPGRPRHKIQGPTSAKDPGLPATATVSATAPGPTPSPVCLMKFFCSSFASSWMAPRPLRPTDRASRRLNHDQTRNTFGIATRPPDNSVVVLRNCSSPIFASATVPPLSSVSRRFPRTPPSAGTLALSRSIWDCTMTTTGSPLLASFKLR
jgi:hypothetical protein